ncbi:hypothetical protein BKA81DRAFT_365080 [Phyllosticta paracitricarpa]
MFPNGHLGKDFRMAGISEAQSPSRFGFPLLHSIAKRACLGVGSAVDQPCVFNSDPLIRSMTS